MKDIVIYGSGGMALEIVQIIEDINTIEPTWNILGYIDDSRGEQGDDKPVVNGYKVLGSHSIVKDFNASVYWVIAVSNPKAKKDIHASLDKYKLKYATLVHPTAKLSKNVTLGEGTIINVGCILSVNVVLGAQVYLNMGSIIGHDAVICDYSTCLLSCIVAGNVLINECVLLGSNCVIKEKKTVGKNSKIGMGATVFFDVGENVVVLNQPPKTVIQ